MSRRKQARPIRHLESEDGLVSSLPNGKYVTLHGAVVSYVCTIPRGDVSVRQGLVLVSFHRDLVLHPFRGTESVFFDAATTANSRQWRPQDHAWVVTTSSQCLV